MNIIVKYSCFQDVNEGGGGDQLKLSVPLAYQRAEFTEDQLHQFLRLCLTDSQFPKFVGWVEKELELVSSEMTQAGVHTSQN